MPSPLTKMTLFPCGAGAGADADAVGVDAVDEPAVGEQAAKPSAVTAATTIRTEAERWCGDRTRVMRYSRGNDDGST
jgi:hypothetical protein